MKRAIILAALLGLSCSPEASGQQRQCASRLKVAPKSDVAQPIVVLLESDPWAMVIGSDSPKLALYDDGIVIFRTEGGFKTVKLSRTEMDEFKTSLNPDALACMVGTYEASLATDQPTKSIFFGRGGPLERISVYGEAAGPKVPAEIVKAYDKLADFDHPGASSWLPEKIEVMIWPYEYAPQASIKWPDKWPGLTSSDAVKRGDGYSIFMRAAEYPGLVKFLEGRKEKGAVEIGGKKWAADVRFPFPDESRWMAQASN